MDEYDCFDENSMFKPMSNEQEVCEYFDSEYFKKYTDGEDPF